MRLLASNATFRGSRHKIHAEKRTSDRVERVRTKTDKVRSASEAIANRIRGMFLYAYPAPGLNTQGSEHVPENELVHVRI